jgi:predicted short-subunit dehydrogenase-like oxidoreductase (DUF2520 family)
MKVQKTAGLVGAGGVSRSFLARMPAVLARLGPVKGASYQVSRRIANGLHAGFGVSSYGALQECELIWIAVPEYMLDSVTQQLADEIHLDGKIVVLCDALRDSLCPSPLRTAGARLASLHCVPASEERIFAAEGHAAAMTELRRLLAMDARKLISLRAASKALYLSGVCLGAYLLLPWIAGAVESLRAAGFPRAEAMCAVQALGARALRAYGKAGDKAWNRAAAERLHRAIERDLEVIRLTDPRLAILYSTGAGCLQHFFREQRKSASKEPWLSPEPATILR